NCTNNCGTTINTQQVPVPDLRPAWGNQTSVVSPTNQISFQHYQDPASGQPDYSLVQNQGQNMITSYMYDDLGRVLEKYMPKANANATIQPGTGFLDDNGHPKDSTYQTDYIYYGDNFDGDSDDVGGGTDTDGDDDSFSGADAWACGGGIANQYGQL